jgi:hypothetical protein
MEMMVSGIYPGAGTSALYIGLGFIPKRVEIHNLDQAEQEILVWDDAMARAAIAPGGQVRTALTSADAANFVVLAQNAGIEPYDGGYVVAALSANYLVPAHEAGVGGDQRDASGGTGPVRKWTLGNSSNRTGNFNAGVDTTNVGVGSVVEIEGLRYKVQAISNDGDAANEVTLDRAAPTGVVRFIGYKYDFWRAPVGTTMPRGIIIRDVTYVNVSGQECLLKAYR